MVTPAPRVEGVLRTNAADLLAYFERRIEPRADAADLLTETMLTAWRRAADLPDDDEGARRWLFGIARNLLLNAWRGSRRRSRLARRVRDLLVEPPAPAADEGGEVRDALRRLSPELREIVTLVHWEGLPLTDVAAIVGLPVSTARRRYLQAKEELRAALTTVAADS